jgi:hypothetical protein
VQPTRASSVNKHKRIRNERMNIPPFVLPRAYRQSVQNGQSSIHSAIRRQCFFDLSQQFITAAALEGQFIIGVYC